MSIEVTSATANNMTTENTNSITNQAILAKDDFLSLLITQMKYQDPLNPMDNQKFASQLAQFSQVEQLENIDRNLEESININTILTQSISNTLATTFIGKEAKGFGNSVLIDNEGHASLSFKLATAAKDLKITITDSSGNTIRTLTMSDFTSGEHEIDWDLKNDAGETLPEGDYQFSVSATDSQGESVNVEEMMSGTITGIRYVEGIAMMMISDSEIPFSMVYEIGENGDESNEG